MMYNNYMYQPKNSILWVQGEAGAKSFIVGAGQTVLLMDSEADKFYIKSADMSGMPSLRVFSYSEIMPTNAPNSHFKGETDNFITRDELEAKLSDFRKELKNEQSVSKRSAKEV